MRQNLAAMDAFTDIEQVLMINLRPSDVKEALFYIPSLGKLRAEGNEHLIAKAVDLIKNSLR